MKLNQTLPALIGLLLVGCAHTTMRGSVAMKTSDDEAHVCLGDREVKAGDRVALYRNVCSSGREKADSSPCEKKRLGEGTVERTLNQHYSVVKVDPGVSFEEGTLVEKL